MKRFVIGDIHGAHMALVQCLKRSGFNKQEDILICLGDLCDGWPDVAEVMDELLGIPNLILIMGNHDKWLMNWFETGATPYVWLMQGGRATISSFKSNISSSHRQLLRTARLYYKFQNCLFVHGGFLPDIPLEQQDEEVFLWDRSLVNKTFESAGNKRDEKLTAFDCVFVGHTPTLNFGETSPIQACDVCLMDTGAGWPGGVLTIMDIDTRQYFCSDIVSELYNQSGSYSRNMG